MGSLLNLEIMQHPIDIFSAPIFLFLMYILIIFWEALTKNFANFTKRGCKPVGTHQVFGFLKIP